MDEKQAQESLEDMTVTFNRVLKRDKLSLKYTEELGGWWIVRTSNNIIGSGHSVTLAILDAYDQLVTWSDGPPIDSIRHI